MNLSMTAQIDPGQGRPSSVSTWLEIAVDFGDDSLGGWKRVGTAPRMGLLTGHTHEQHQPDAGPNRRVADAFDLLIVDGATVSAPLCGSH